MGTHKTQRLLAGGGKLAEGDHSHSTWATGMDQCSFFVSKSSSGGDAASLMLYSGKEYKTHRENREVHWLTYKVSLQRYSKT